MKLLRNCDYDFFVFRHQFHITSPKFLKFERVQNSAVKFWIVQKLFWAQPFSLRQNFVPFRLVTEWNLLLCTNVAVTYPKCLNLSSNSPKQFLTSQVNASLRRLLCMTGVSQKMQRWRKKWISSGRFILICNKLECLSPELFSSLA
jgi:hypothetical protein